MASSGQCFFLSVSTAALWRRSGFDFQVSGTGVIAARHTVPRQCPAHQPPARYDVSDARTRLLVS